MEPSEEPKLRTLVLNLPKSISVSSPAFTNGGRIPDRYTCMGADVSPPLRIEGVPEGTKSLALIMYDPDAPFGTFFHWTLYGVPPEKKELPENIPKVGITDYGKQGRNDFGRIGYGGPCPPPGHGTHRYYFTFMALSEEPDVPEGATVDQLVKALKGKVLAYGYLMGTYSR